MKTKNLLLVLALGFIVSAFGQKPTMELTFTALDNNVHVQLDSIKVLNKTQSGDTTLYWPDTVLVLFYQVGINEINNTGKNLRLFQNYPNPVKDQTTIDLYIPEKGKVNLVITDISGRQIINTEKLLDKGYHSFKYTPGSEDVFFFTAYWKSTSESIKIITYGSSSAHTSSLEYLGSKPYEALLKNTENTRSFSYNLGDKLIYTGFSNGLQIGILDIPETSTDYTFQIATCPGTPTLIDADGNVYNTVQIGNQCWMRENLNYETVNSWWYGDNPANGDVYGRLYTWEAALTACPDGWHLPSDNEWKILEMEIGMSQGDADAIGWRGVGIGNKLKSTVGWSNTGNNCHGFTGRPGGYRHNAGEYFLIGSDSFWWNSKSYGSNYGWYRSLYSGKSEIERHYWYYLVGFSVRCVKN